MRKPRIGHLLTALVGCLFAAGCRTPVSTHAALVTLPTPYEPRPDSPNAFDHYARAALEAEIADPKQLTQVYFYPGQRKTAERLCAAAVKVVEDAERMPCDFKFVPHAPFVGPPYQAGWRLIGRAMRWQIDDDAQAANWDGAVGKTISTTRFGFDLTGGGPTDASLGLAIADDARVAILPYLSKMGAGQLQRLADGIGEDLQRKPPIIDAISHESENIRLAEATLRNAAERNHFDEIIANLGPDVKEAVDYLQGLRGNDAKLSEYFRGFDAEGDDQTHYLLEVAPMAVAHRPDPPKPKAKERPWKHFAHDFFTAGAPLLSMDDRTVARTRLLVLTCELMKAQKLTKSYPTNLAGLDPSLATDPYSGNPFRYRSDGTDFSLYSVGENLRDDGGDTDDSFTTPDLKLEMKP